MSKSFWSFRTFSVILMPIFRNYSVVLGIKNRNYSDCRQKASPPGPLRSGGLFDEIFVVVNTEECGAKQQELGYEQQDGVVDVACGWQQQSHCREDYRHHP